MKNHDPSLDRAGEILPTGDEHDDILDEYRRRQMIEHLAGPMISLLLHAILVVACVVLLVGREVRDETAFEFNTRELEVKPLDPETLEQLDLLEETPLDRVVPTVERPTITPESLDVETPDFSEALAATEMDLDLTVLDVKITTSPVTLPGLYRNRTAEGRRIALTRHGGRWAQATERAVVKALVWLKENQHEDGSWRMDGHHSRAAAGSTGLGLLTFLAHGETHLSEDYGDTVRRAITYLISIQRDDGTFEQVENGLKGGVYAHGIATYALSEAYALTKIPALRPVVEKAVARIIRGQRPDGGFDYKFARDGGGRDRCTSVAGWMAQAMKAAHLAGVEAPGLEEALERAAAGFKLNYVADAKQFIYASGHGTPRPNINQTPTAVLSLQLLGHGQSREAQGGLDSISSAFNLDWQRPMSVLEPLYGWYYATQAVFHGGVRHFRPWNETMAPMLVNNQQADGSWLLPESHGRSHTYGPAYSTTLSALILTVYYRYLPTYQNPEERRVSQNIFGLDDELLVE